MANFEFKTHRVTELPASLEAYSVYYVAPAGTTDYVEIYVSSADGLSARRVINEADVRTLISEEMSGLAESKTVFNHNTGNRINIWIGTQTEYDAVVTKDSATLYMVK